MEAIKPLFSDRVASYHFPLFILFSLSLLIVSVDGVRFDRISFGEQGLFSDWEFSMETPTYLGIDCGSVSLNLVLRGGAPKEPLCIYRRTQGRPLHTLVGGGG